MGQGHGAIQRWVLELLDALNDEMCPDRWYDMEGLGLIAEGERASASLSVSFRRAVNNLADEGLLEIAYGFAARYDASESDYFRNGAGGRRRIVVRSPPSPQEMRDAAAVHQKHVDAIRFRETLQTLGWYDRSYTTKFGIFIPWDELKRHGLTHTRDEALWERMRLEEGRPPERKRAPA